LTPARPTGLTRVYTTYWGGHRQELHSRAGYVTVQLVYVIDNYNMLTIICRVNPNPSCIYIMVRVNPNPSCIYIMVRVNPVDTGASNLIL